MALSSKERLFFKGLCAFIWGKKSNQICSIQIPNSRGADCHRIYRDELPKMKTDGGIIGIHLTC